MLIWGNVSVELIFVPEGESLTVLLWCEKYGKSVVGKVSQRVCVGDWNHNEGYG